MLPANTLTECASLLMRSLADAGVRDIVVSPGSRSTPYVIAAVREPRLRRHSVVDERAAGFFALGQARVTGQPTALLCTSGSAAAEYFPAIVEASLAHVPLVVLTADRPPELYDCHAPQTIDQTKLFGGYVRRFFDLQPQPTEGGLRAVRRIASQAVWESLWPLPGPVHVNARASKPLEPAAASTPAERAFEHMALRIAAEPWTKGQIPVAQVRDEAVEDAAALCRSAKRGLIACGPAPVSQGAAADAIEALSRATTFPIWADATSQLRFSPNIERQADALDVVWRTRTGRARFVPDLVVQIGSPPISNAWELLAPNVPRVVVAAYDWYDPWSSARLMLWGDVATAARALADACTNRSGGDESLVAASTAAWNVTDSALAGTHLSEGWAVRSLVARLPRHSLLMVGNSLAVRLVDAYCKHDSAQVAVLSQRGASGIDGLVAGAAGAALVSDQPVTLLLGDVSLMHDLTSLDLARRARVPVPIVVLHNRGGRIFEQLPLARAPGIEREVMDLTLTPHAVDFARAATLFDLPFARIDRRQDLAKALDEGYGRTGPTLIQVELAEHGAAEEQARIVSSLEGVLATLP